MSLHERRLEAQLDRMEKMLADLCRDSKDLKEVDPSPRPVLSDIAPSPVQDSGVSARALAVELETKPKETSEVLPTTPVSGLENDPQETRTSDTGERSHSASTARRFDRSHTTFHEAEKGHFWRLVHWILPTVDPKPSGPLADFVRSHLFERLSLSAIILSVCFTIYKTDYIASTLSDEQEIWMTVGESTILGIFVSELVMKMMVYGGYMLMSKEDGGWNLLDLIIVTFATVEMIMEHVGSGALEVGVMRVIRLLRVLKILRIFRAFRFLDELRLMVSCMLGSMTSLLWSIMLIMVILLIAGLTFVQMVSQLQMDFPEKIAADANLKNMINAHFSGVGLAMLELFMSTTGGREWGPLYDVVKQSGYTGAIAFVLYIARLKRYSGGYSPLVSPQRSHVGRRWCRARRGCRQGRHPGQSASPDRGGHRGGGCMRLCGARDHCCWGFHFGGCAGRNAARVRACRGRRLFRGAFICFACEAIRAPTTQEGTTQGTPSRGQPSVGPGQ